jgi:glycerophosphoryl diester phosphodiesterase
MGGPSCVAVGAGRGTSAYWRSTALRADRPATRRARWLALVDRAFLDNAHRRGIDVHVWTVNDPAQMMRLLDLGVDGIMTDRADLLRDVLTRRGQWL